MALKQIASIQFIDTEQDQEAVVIVRASKKTIAIAISLKDDGDAEVFMSQQDGLRLFQAIKEAMTFASAEESVGEGVSSQ